MMPFTPMNDNFERVVTNSEEGLPEEGAPAAEGGVGADMPELDQSEEALRQEKALDEEQGQENDKA
jgi:hypothetical protein